MCLLLKSEGPGKLEADGPAPYCVQWNARVMSNLKCRESNFDTNSGERFLSNLTSSGTFLLADSVIIHCCVSFYNNDLRGVGGLLFLTFEEQVLEQMTRQHVRS